MNVTKTKKEKPAPENCVCGRPAILVKTKHGKMFSCPNPIRCEANLRSTWERSEAEAVAKWNTLVWSYAGEKNSHRSTRGE